jgi:alpha-tubulin suppressor-like RCC1 family protein
VNDLYPVEGKTISKLFTHVTATPSTMILTTEPKLYVTGTNSFGKFGMGVSTASYSAWTESPWSTTPGTAGLTISDVFAANGDVNSGPNFILATDGVNKSLWAAGNNVEGACGRGASASNIVTWTRLHLPSDIVNLISDVQIGSASGSNFTALLLTNGTVYFTGRNDYTPDANLPHGTDRHNFTYIRNI